MGRCRRIIIFRIIMTIISGLIITGCTVTSWQIKSALDSPEHHSSNGFKLMERFDDAQREFELALELVPEYSPAHRGLGLLYGMKKNFKPAFESMRRAEYHAKNSVDKALAYVGFIRLYTMKRDKDWLVEAEKNFLQARSMVQDLPDAYYFMGIAYKYGYRFTESMKAFKQVLKINRTFMTRADEQFKIVQKIDKVNPVSESGKRVVFMDHVTRADIASLIIQELGLDRVNKNVRSHSNALLRSITLPPDVENHPLREDIRTIIQLDIQGLRPLPDGTFRPDEYINRANYAIIIAHIINMVKDDPSLSTRYSGSISPFLDVRNNAPYFNAIMICTTHYRIMETKDWIFDPKGKVSGVEALLVIQRLKEKLGIETG